MRIAVDAMGGDHAPGEIVSGAVRAIQTLPELSKLYLVGDEAAIQKELSLHGAISPKIEIVVATQVVEMCESPAASVRKKKDSSISRAVDLVKAGKADALFSAGNTGAAVAATTLKLRTLEGVSRPAIATIMPTLTNPCILIDAGANTDCTSRMLMEFAIMGSVYSREILGRASPRVGLLSIGGEEAKGNDITKDAFRLLEKAPIEFCGNVESRDFFQGDVDVAVCDGFVGNVVLKTSESVAHAVSRWLRIELTKNPIRILGALLCKGAFNAIKERSDPETHGGAPLLGANGVCIIGHGSSTVKAVSNAINVACEAVKHDINHIIINDLKQVDG